MTQATCATNMSRIQYGRAH